MADDEIAVTIENESNGGITAQVEGVAAEPVDDLKAQVADLKAARQRDSDRIAAAERAAALARNQAQEASARAETVGKQAVEREGESVETGISAATAAIDSAKKEIKNAGEAGDHGAQAEAYDRLVAARARLERLNGQKADVEIRKTEAARPKPEERREIARPSTDDPFEQMLADMASNGAARSADWIRRNREVWADETKNNEVRAAHFEAMSKKIKPESDEYFEYIEKRVGLREAEPAAKTEAAKTETRTQPRRPPVAPVAQSGGGMNGSGAATVRLTQKQAASATDGTLVWNYPDPTGQNRWKVGDPIGIQEMARRVHEQTKQGLYDAGNISV
jgi:hypothetical protein